MEFLLLHSSVSLMDNINDPVNHTSYGEEYLHGLR